LLSAAATVIFTMWGETGFLEHKRLAILNIIVFNYTQKYRPNVNHRLAVFVIVLSFVGIVQRTRRHLWVVLGRFAQQHLSTLILPSRLEKKIVLYSLCFALAKKDARGH
jgi:hypothetical protein